MLEKKHLIFIALKEGDFLSALQIKSKVNMVTLLKNIKSFEMMGLINTEKIGKKKVLSLTEKGNKIQQHLIKINQILKNE